MSDIVEVLRIYLKKHPDVYAAFDLAVKMALRMRVPQLAKLKIRGLEDYLSFYESFLHWIPTEEFDAKGVYYHLCIFYFILDLPPLRRLQTPILPTSKSHHRTYLSNWIIQFAKEMGANMDEPESLTKDSLQTFKDSPAYRMQDYVEPIGGWTTFNHFFTRELRSGLRLIDFPHDDTCIVSPADSVFDGYWNVESNGVVYFKYIPWNIGQLLADSKYKGAFNGGVFTHSYLAPRDYHRQHAPVYGEVVETKRIDGLCYLEVVASPDENGDLSLGMRRGLPPAKLGRGADKKLEGTASLEEHEVSMPDSSGYQFLQARGLIVIDNPVLGLVAALPIGMAQVSSVKITVKEGQTVSKGQEISYFQFGGSDFVMVFQKKAGVRFSATIGQHYNYGNQIAKAFPRRNKL